MWPPWSTLGATTKGLEGGVVDQHSSKGKETFAEGML